VKKDEVVDSIVVVDSKVVVVVVEHSSYAQHVVLPFSQSHGPFKLSHVSA
jgi:hypothetical protein